MATLPVPVARCWTKAISGEKPGQIVRSGKWVLARRAWLDFHADRLACGDWDIPYATASDIVLYKGRQFPWPVKVLEVVVGSKAFHFGLNPWCRVERHLRTEFRTEALHLQHSPFSIVLRLVLLGYLGYLLWSRLS